jgi:hypothetical protein
MYIDESKAVFLVADYYSLPFTITFNRSLITASLKLLIYKSLVMSAVISSGFVVGA